MPAVPAKPPTEVSATRDDVDDLVLLVAVEVGDADQAGGVTEPSSVTSSVSPATRPAP